MRFKVKTQMRSELPPATGHASRVGCTTTLDLRHFRISAKPWSDQIVRSPLHSGAARYRPGNRPIVLGQCIACAKSAMKAGSSHRFASQLFPARLCFCAHQSFSLEVSAVGRSPTSSPRSNRTASSKTACRADHLRASNTSGRRARYGPV